MPIVRREQSGFAFPLMNKGAAMGALHFRKDNTLALVKDSVHQILMTTPGERFWNPEFGCRAKLLVFEAATETTKETAKSLVYEALTRWERRANFDPADIFVEESYLPLTPLLIMVNYTIKDSGFDTEQQSVTVTY